MPNICSQLIPLYTQWKQSLEELSQARVRFTQTGEKGDYQAITDLQATVETIQKAYTHEAYETLVAYRTYELCAVEATVAEAIDQRLVAGAGDKLTLTVKSGRIIEVSALGNTSTNIADALKLLRHLSSLTRLYLADTPVSKIENLPDSLTELHLTGTTVSQIENLTDSLTELSLTSTTVSKIENLPDSLTRLYLADTPVSKIENLPTSLARLYLNGTPVSKIENLPDSLVWLNLKGTPASKDPEQIAILNEFKRTHPGFNYVI